MNDMNESSGSLDTALIGMLLGPFFRFLVKLFAIIFVKICRICLNSVIRDRLHQELLGCSQDRCQLARRLPDISLEHAQAHRAVLVVGDVRMVDLGLEVELGRFERVVGRQDEEELEFAALVWIT